MAKFKQKNFFWGTALMVGTSALGLKQGSDAAAQQEEANMQQMKEMKRHNRAMEAAAKQNAASSLNAEEGQRVFASVSGVFQAIKNSQAGGLVKDLYGIHKGNLKSAAKMGASFAALGYAGNRIAASVKDAKENNNEGNKNFLKKAAIGVGTVGAGVLAARKGLMGKTVKEVMTTGKGGQMLSKAKTTLNPIKRTQDGKIDMGSTGMGLAMNGAFLAVPTVSYLAKKRAENNMVDNTQSQQPVQTQYSGMINTAVNYAKHAWKNPSRAITGGMTHVGKLAGGFFGKGGTSAVQNTFNKLKTAGAEGSWSRKLGEWATKKDASGKLVNAGKANLLATAGTVAVGGAAMKAGESVINKPMKKFDSDAYKMEENQ